MERYFLDIIEEKRSAPFLQSLLALLSKPYQIAIKGRNLAYDRGWLSSFRATLPVVSIGNLVVGGTGKTPLVQMLTLALQAEGKIAILTRGFRSEAEDREEPLHIDRHHFLPPDKCGDEPLLLAQTTEAEVWIGKNRVRSAQLAATRGVDCLILDDGLQHRRLHRDVEIVVIDAKNPFSDHRFLPYGLLRDLPTRLQNADLIVATHTQDLAHYEEVKKEIEAYTQAPVVGMQHQLEFPQSLYGEKIGAFCGIGKPGYFFGALEKAGAEIVAMHRLLDHQAFPFEELKAFVSLSRDRGAQRIICTQKDWVKMGKAERTLPVEPVDLRLNILAGKEHWDQMIEKIKQKMKGFK
jgi:tetraacyldisaccharide 4'-kinase